MPDTPSGGTCADLAKDHATCADMAAAYETCADLLAAYTAKAMEKS
jgi:hypothetical protein